MRKKVTVLGVVRRTSALAVVTALVLAVTGLAGPTPPPPAAAAPAGGGSGGTYVPVTPYRLLDTRLRAGAVPVAANGEVAVTASGPGGSPMTGIAAVAVTLTVTGGRATGFVTAYADGTSNPGTSNLNWVMGQTVANGAVVPVSPDGRFRVHSTSLGTVHLVIDVTGYYRDGKPTAAGAYTPLPLTRVLDTRRGVGVAGTTPLGHLQRVRVPVAARGQAAAGASGVVLNLTVTAPTAVGFVTVGGPGEPPYGGSALNWRAGQTVANLVLAPVDPDGSVSLQVSSIGGTAHLVADLVGFTTSGPLAQVGATSVQRPYRLVDTRTGGSGAVAAFGTLAVSTAGGPRAFAAGEVSAAVVDVVVTAPTAGGFLTAWATGTSAPGTSSLNWAPGQTVAAAVTVPVSPDGSFSLRNLSHGTAHVVVDLEGLVLGRPVVDAPGWSSEQVPGSDLGQGTASGVSDVACADGPTCALIGAVEGPNGQSGTRLVRWDGTSWGADAALLPASRTDGAVACSATALCVAALPQDRTSQVASSTATGGWTVEAPPADALGRGAVVRRVACPPGGTSCLAVGQAFANGSATSVPYATAYGPGGWQPLPVPVTGSSGALVDLACASAASCVAVGSVSVGGTETSLVATWDGAAWTTQTLAVPGATSSSAYRVAVGGAGDYTLTGVVSGGATRYTAVRTAGSWSTSTVADASFTGGALVCQGVGTGCWAGSARLQALGSVPGGAPVTFAVGDGPRPTTLSSLSCPASWCEGVAPMISSLVGDRGVVLDQTGGTWTTGAAPTPPDAVEGVPDWRVGVTSQVSCWSGGCLLVGPYPARSRGQALKADVLLRSS